MKYFYTDPLAAAWMAKHHGMRFVNDNPRQGTDWAKDKTLYYEAECYYIHPDSVHLLEPQLGDGVSTKGDHFIPYNYNTITILKEGKPDLVWGDDSAIMEHGEYKIIQRNGIAFMWPETET